jgi:branched-chain amino acid transport system substrate-binding protein
MRTVRTALIGALLLGLLPGPAAASLASPGVTPKRITIGIHAPFTGASPLPSSSVEKGADLYFRWLEEKARRIHGRYVDVVIKNDNSNPSQALAVCKEMVEKDSVFMLVGIAGAEQMHACSRYAKKKGVPYVSWGASKYGMKRMPRYFATSMTFEQQARLVADLLVTKHNAKEQQNAIVWTNSPSYQGAYDRFLAVMEKRGAQVHLDRSVGIAAGQTEAQTVAAEMNVAGIDNVFFLGRTTFWIQLEESSRRQGDDVQWVSVAPMFGTDAAVRIVCQNSSNDVDAATLSFTPAYGDRGRFDPRHDKAMQRVHGEAGDETTWQGWAMGRNLGAMLRVAPRKLTRRSFARSVSDATISTGIGPRLPYGTGGSFVARQAHLLRADCAPRRWNTTKAFVSNF